MTVYYVAKTGNDSNAGTSQAAPKLTIASAVDHKLAVAMRSAWQDCLARSACEKDLLILDELGVIADRDIV